MFIKAHNKLEGCKLKQNMSLTDDDIPDAAEKMTNCILLELFKCVDRVSGSKVLNVLDQSTFLVAGGCVRSLWVKPIKIVLDGND